MATLNVKNYGNVEVEYIVAELDDIKASHIPDCNFIPNSAYAFENERLYHKETASQEDVLTCAATLNANLLMESPTATDGAPIVDNAGNVMGGNTRAMAIQLAWTRYPERYNAYKQAIGEKYNIRPFNKPILVRVIQRYFDKGEGQKLISALNDNFTKAREKRADARSRGMRLSKQTLNELATGMSKFNTLRDYFSNSQSRLAVQMLIKDGVILDNERNIYIDLDGMLTTDAKTLIESALRSRLFDSYEVLSRIPQSIVAKIDAMIPYIVQTANIEKWSLAEHINNACKMVIEYKTGIDKNEDSKLYLSHCDLSKGGQCPADFYGKIATTLFNMLLKSTKKTLVEKVKKYVTSAKDSSEAGGFGFGLSYEAAIKAYFNISLQRKARAKKAETKIENEVSGTISNEENKHAEKKTRATKNDCNKQNSKLIKGVQNDDIAAILPLAYDIIDPAIELQANSKTQYKIMLHGEELLGYRVIRSGNRWQIRLLNGYQEYDKQDTQAVNTNNQETIIDATNNIQFLSYDYTYDNIELPNIVYICDQDNIPIEDCNTFSFYKLSNNCMNLKVIDSKNSTYIRPYKGKCYKFSLKYNANGFIDISYNGKHIARQNIHYGFNTDGNYIRLAHDLADITGNNLDGVYIHNDNIDNIVIHKKNMTQYLVYNYVYDRTNINLSEIDNQKYQHLECQFELTDNFNLNNDKDNILIQDGLCTFFLNKIMLILLGMIRHANWKDRQIFKSIIENTANGKEYIETIKESLIMEAQAKYLSYNKAMALYQLVKSLYIRNDAYLWNCLEFTEYAYEISKRQHEDEVKPCNFAIQTGTHNQLASVNILGAVKTAQKRPYTPFSMQAFSWVHKNMEHLPQANLTAKLDMTGGIAR